MAPLLDRVDSLTSVDTTPAFRPNDKLFEVNDVKRNSKPAVEETYTAAAPKPESNSTDEDKAKRIADAHTTYYPHPTNLKLGEHPIDEIRQLKVDGSCANTRKLALTINRLQSLGADSVDSQLAHCYLRKCLASN